MSKNYGLIGEKLGHSISPQIHKLIFEKLKINGQYKKYEIDKLNIEKFILDLKNQEIEGLNVTIPYKETVIKHLDSYSEEVAHIGAVNTIKIIEGKLIGYNTDYYGFKATIYRNNINLVDKTVFILGTGGAAKSVYAYIKSQPVKKIYLVSRNEKDVNLSLKYKEATIIGYEKLETFKSLDIIINTTPIGMYPNTDNSPVDFKNQSCECCIDLIYNPVETRLLLAAKAKGAITVNGLEMLVAQAIKAEEIWGDYELTDIERDKLLFEILMKIGKF